MKNILHIFCKVINNIMIISFIKKNFPIDDLRFKAFQPECIVVGLHESLEVIFFLK